MVLLPNRDHEERPWGFFDRFTLNEHSTVKIICLKPHQKLSLQTHTKRSEFWHIISGSGEVIVGETALPAKEQDDFEVQVGAAHRAIAGAEGLSFLEIALGEFDEHDETRLEDLYGRGSPGT